MTHVRLRFRAARNTIEGVFVSQKIFAAILLVLSLTVPAFAESGAPPAHNAPASAANKPDALTPDQARRALDTLQDDKKRAQIIETLRAIAGASPQAQAAQPAPEKQSAIPLTADSLGAQLLETVSDQIGEISHQIADVARSLTHFRAFYWWFVRTANDPNAYGQLLDIAWKLALVFCCAFAAEWLAFRLIKRPVTFFEGRIPQAASAPLPIANTPSAAADMVAPAPQRRRLSLIRAWQAMLRLPFVLGRLLLELLPVAVFTGFATMLLGTDLGATPTTRLVILAVVNAYALSRALICAVRALAGPFGLLPV